MKNNFLLVISLFVLFQFLNSKLCAQKSKTDSLLVELEITKEDTAKADLLNQLTLILSRSYPDSALIFAFEAEAIIAGINDKFRLAEIYKNIGNIYNGKDNFRKADSYYQRSLQIYQELEHRLGLAMIYNNLGVLNRIQGNYIHTLEYYQKSLDLRKQLGDKQGMGKTLNNIGVVHQSQGNLDLALNYFMESLEIRKEFNDKLGMSGCFNNIGSIYLDKKNYKLATDYFRYSLELYRDFEDKTGIAQSYRYMGIAYTGLIEYERATDYFSKALRIDRELGNQIGMSTSLTNMALIHNKREDYEQAKHFARMSLDIALEIGSTLEEKNAYEQLFQAYEGLKAFKKALAYHKLFLSTKDSLFSIEKSKELESIERRYQTENKQLQIENLENDNKLKITQLEKMKNRQWFSGVLLFVFIVYIIELLFVRRKLKMKNFRIFEQNEEILTQKNELERHRNHLEKLVEERTNDLEAAKEKAEESDRLKSSFLANMSHEIRTPMNAIIGFSSILAEGQEDPDSNIALSNEISKNSFSLLNLIDNILDLAKIQTNQLKIEFSDFNINDFLTDIYYRYYEMITNNKLKFILKLKNQNDVILNSDPNRLRQILKNVVENALKYTEEGFIEMGYTLQNENLTIYVKDSGIGMNNQQLESIFARFSKIEDEKQKLYRGAGLGLAICKQMIQMLQGEIRVESETGKGTTFFLNLPIQQVNKSEEQESETSFLNSNYNWEQKTILIAEDDPSNFHYFCELLFETKIKIEHAQNGIEAIRKAKQSKFNLILMDIKMPEMNGLEATRLIKQIDSDIPIIAQTAFALENEEKLCLEAGCIAYIQKPIHKHQLFSLMQQFLN